MDSPGSKKRGIKADLPYLFPQLQKIAQHVSQLSGQRQAQAASAFNFCRQESVLEDSMQRRTLDVHTS
jgi:hypothetical protein